MRKGLLYAALAAFVLALSGCGEEAAAPPAEPPADAAPAETPAEPPADGAPSE
jgi:hypothetical protein